MSFNEEKDMRIEKVKFFNLTISLNDSTWYEMYPYSVTVEKGDKLWSRKFFVTKNGAKKHMEKYLSTLREFAQLLDILS